MGWSITLTADRPLRHRDVSVVVTKVGGGRMVREQAWGWSAVCDVSNPAGKTLRISGAWFSADAAKGFAADVKRGLEAMDYKIKVSRLQ